MGFFSRKSQPSSATPQVYDPIGRKLTSKNSLSATEEIFRSLAADESSMAGDIFFEPIWDDPDTTPPDLLLAARLTADTSLYLAVWDRGSELELYVVPPDYASPSIEGPHFPIFGLWKQRDRSLTSIGGVMSFPVIDS